MNQVREQKWWRDEPTGDLELEVSGVPNPSIFDNETHGVEPWKKVDFVFHWPAENLLWLVEIKDPDNPHANGDRERLVEQFQSEQLIHRSLAGKAKDSFLYLLLEGRLATDVKITYVVLFACARLNTRLYHNATRELRRALAINGPAGRNWAKQGLFIQNCLIVSLDEWNATFGTRILIRRMSTAHDESLDSPTHA